MAERNVLLATNIDDIRGGLPAVLADWGTAWASEKYDGLRATATLDPYGDAVLLSSQGKAFSVLCSWRAKLTKVIKTLNAYYGKNVVLDGELWLGRGSMQATQSIVRRKEPDSRWKDMIYQVFDVPTLGVMSSAKGGLELIASMRYREVQAADQQLVSDPSEVDGFFDHIISEGGEGLMLRHPKLLWQPKRSRHLLKIKPENDGECVVTGYTAGKGRLEGMLGALAVNWTNDKGTVSFELAGLSDAERSVGWETRFPIGGEVPFRYTSLTDRGVPREARYWRGRCS
mgnify:CR=1 FL=1